MESGVFKVYTKDKKRLVISAIFENGKKEEVYKKYKENIGNTVFTSSKDVFFIDVFLANLMSDFSDKNVFGCGVSVQTEVSALNGGGVIGNPFEESESADDGIEYIGNGLYCIAYSGRWGCIFKAEKDTAEKIYLKTEEICNKDVKTALAELKETLCDNVDVFIIISDGCGDGSVMYACAGNSGKTEELY